MDDHIQNGCLLPLAQAVITGVLVGLLALAGCLYWDLPKAGVIALATGTGGAVLMWLAGLTTWRRSQFDDVFYSPPSPPSPALDRVKVELSRPLDGPGKQTQLVDLPATKKQLEELAVGVMRGAPLAESAWSGPGRPFTRSEFAALRAELLRRGWCSWRREDSPGQGVVLSSQGKAVMRSFASVSPSPLPRGGDD